MLLKGMEFDTAHFITDVSGKYPRLWALKGAHPVTVNRWYKFGVLASIRTIAPGFREISELPDWVGRKRIKAVLGIAEGILDYGITCCGCVIEVCGASSPCKTRWIRPGSTSVKKGDRTQNEEPKFGGDDSNLDEDGKSVNFDIMYNVEVFCEPKFT
ncbi:hypothetical protein ACS0TY_017298 [Phlomoides rotata]